MISRVEALYNLQLIDVEVDEKRRALAQIEVQLEENAELLSARRKVAGEEDRLREPRAELRTLELDLEGIASKIVGTKEVLYGGRVTNPKELAGLERELEYLERRQSDIEDKTLEAMAKVEDREASSRESDEHVRRLEREWEAMQGDLRRRAGELESRLEALEKERGRAFLDVCEEDLSAYEDLRRRKGGQAIALLKNGICQGCGLALPTSLAQKVRRGQDLVFCGSCERILHSLT